MRELRFERGVAFAVRSGILHVAERRQQPQRKVKLHARLHTGAEDAQVGTVCTRELLQPEATCGTGAHGCDCVAVYDAGGAPSGRVDQHDSGLVGLSAKPAVVWPESGRLEAEQALRLNIPRLDAEYAPRDEWLPDQGEHAALALTMQHECLAHGSQDIVMEQQGLDLVLSEQQEARVTWHRCTAPKFVSSYGQNIQYRTYCQERFLGSAGGWLPLALRQAQMRCRIRRSTEPRSQQRWGQHHEM